MLNQSRRHTSNNTLHLLQCPYNNDDFKVHSINSGTEALLHELGVMYLITVKMHLFSKKKVSNNESVSYKTKVQLWGRG